MNIEQQRKKKWTPITGIPYYIALLCLLGGRLQGQTEIITPDPVVLPPAGQSNYVLSSGSLSVRSGQSITLKPGVHFMAGSTVVLQVDQNFKIPIAPDNPQANTDMNWILSRNFNASGQVVSESKVFYDDLGKASQQQAKNLEYGHVMASQPLYSVYGEAVGSTLSAPINNASFAYKSDFFTTSTGTTYSFRNFARYLNAAGTRQDKTATADAVGGTVAGTLGWYYSEANSWEPYQDVATLPYTVGTDASNGSGIFSRTASVGNELRMGKNREAVSFSVPITKELELYESIRNKYFTEAEVGGRTVVDSAARVMSVSLDADRNVGVSISVDGKSVLSALGGTELTVAKTVSVVANSNAYFPVFASQSVSFSGAASTLVNYVANEAVSNVSTGTVTLNKGLYELRTTTGAQTVSYSLGLGTISMNFYDQLGRLRASIPPEGVKKLLNGGLSGYATLASIPFVQTFEYNAQGLPVVSTNPDQGRSELKYNTEGKIRFSQNALQKQKGSYSYTNYDTYGRAVELGEYLPSGGGVKFENITTTMLDAAGLPSTVGTQSDVKEIQYDIANATHGVAGYVQDSYFLGGAVSYTAKYSLLSNNVKDAAKLVSRSWFSYDGDGNVIWTISNVNGLGNKTMDYDYDEFGRVIKSIYQKNMAAETFVHYYEYDLNGKLKAVFTNLVDNSSSKVLHAKYIYALTGELRRVEYGDKLQGVDYVYTVDGKLKSINNANVGANGVNDPGKDGKGNGFAPDVFSQNMEYYANDYLRAGTNIYGVQNASAPAKYSGLVNGIGWQTQKPNSVIGLDATTMNIFTYDTKGQVLANIWGTPDYGTKVFTGMANVNQEKGISYDNHGNLLKLQRTNAAGTVVNNFTYNYQVGTNKLSSVAGYSNYTYNAVGQLSSQVKGTTEMYLDYDISGKVTTIYSDAAKSVIMFSFVYDDGGNRVMKKDHRTGLITWYSYDAEGNLMAVYETKNGGTPQLIEQLVYGTDRLGILNRLGASYSYTLTDHLGNTRAIINGKKLSSGLAEVQYYADYYPFGIEARSAGIVNRYGYQGLFSEKDKETGWNNFELRNYDANIGRWLTQDPKGQYLSPYVGMGNNPISSFDPDGGWSTWLGAYAYSLIHGGKVRKTEAGIYQVGNVINGMPVITAGRGSGNGMVNFKGFTSAKRQNQSWLENAVNKFRDLGSDHPYFHGPSGGQYGPWLGGEIYVDISGKVSFGVGYSGAISKTVGLTFVPIEKTFMEFNLSSQYHKVDGKLEFNGNNFLATPTTGRYGVAFGIGIDGETGPLEKKRSVGAFGFMTERTLNRSTGKVDQFAGYELGVSNFVGFVGGEVKIKVGYKW